MREANVMDVFWEQIDSTNWQFSVTLLHDDNNENGYADYWVVETTDGMELGRRILAHAHGNIEFTRSELINIPTTILKVIVRGHDQTHNFGGQIAIIDLVLQTMELMDQGSDHNTIAGMETVNTTSGLTSPAFNSSNQSTPIELSKVGLYLLGIGLMSKTKGKK